MRNITDIKPTYVLYDLVKRKAIGYYGITEVATLDKDVDEFLKKNPSYHPGDLQIAFDKWGRTVPIVNEVEDIGL